MELNIRTYGSKHKYTIQNINNSSPPAPGTRSKISKIRDLEKGLFKLINSFLQENFYIELNGHNDHDTKTIFVMILFKNTSMGISISLISHRLAANNNALTVVRGTLHAH